MKKIAALVLLMFTIISNAQDTIVEPEDTTQNPTILGDLTTKKGPWELGLSGFIEADVIIDNKKNAFVDGFMPSYIQSNKTDYSSHASIRQSQVGLKFGNTDLDLSVYFEIDFIGADNKTAPRFRKGYITYKNWKIGQDWSTNADMNTWPNIFDFNGPNGSIGVRRMQIRYTKEVNAKHQYSFALEDPDIPSITVPDDSLGWKMKPVLPNVIATYRYGGETYIRGALTLNPISYDKRYTTKEDFHTETMLGYALNLSSVIKTGKKSKLILQTMYGKGANTITLAFGGEGYDAVPDLNDHNNLKMLPYQMGIVAYEHWWNDKWSSVAYYNYSKIGKEKYMTEGMTKSIQHAALNLVYNPTSYIRMGIEGNYGFTTRYQVENKLEAFRLQISTAVCF